MKIKVMDSIRYIDAAFKEGKGKYFFEDIRKDFLMYMQGYSYIGASSPNIEDEFSGESMAFLYDHDSEGRKENLFGHLPVNDSLIQILKYALIKSYSDERIPGVETFRDIREAILYDGFNEETKNSDGINKNKLLNQTAVVLRYKELLTPLLKAFVECRYREFDETGNICDEYNPEQEVSDVRIKELIDCLKPTGTTNDMDQPIISRITHFIQKKSIDKQVSLQEHSYRFGNNLHAMFRQCSKRYGVKEGVLIKNHPFNRKFKLLAISETEFAKDTATSMILSKLNEWFFNLDPKYYDDINSLRVLFQNVIQRINYELREEFEKIQTSLSVAIVAKNNTLLLSLGFNYCIKDGSIVDMKIGGVRLGTPTCEKNIDKNVRIIENDYDELLLLNSDARSVLAYNSDDILKPKGYIKELRSTCIARPLAAAVYSKGCK